MGYHLSIDIAQDRNSTFGHFLGIPKTHTPVSRLQGRGHRYYSPGLGRWISRDPIGEMGGWNLFCTSGNALVNRYDYIGLLGYSTLVRPEGNVTAGGGYSWQILWAPEPSEQNGFVVQKITYDLRWFNCDNSIREMPPIETFYEAWGVTSGLLGNLDQWTESDHGTSWGTVKTQGTAGFYSGQLPPNLTGFAVGTVPMAGATGLSTYTTPGFWPLSGNLVQRTLTVTWNSCPCQTVYPSVSRNPSW